MKFHTVNREQANVPQGSETHCVWLMGPLGLVKLIIRYGPLEQYCSNVVKFINLIINESTVSLPRNLATQRFYLQFGTDSESRARPTVGLSN